MQHLKGGIGRESHAQEACRDGFVDLLELNGLFANVEAEERHERWLVDEVVVVFLFFVVDDDDVEVFHGDGHVAVFVIQHFVHFLHFFVDHAVFKIRYLIFFLLV